MEHLTEQEHWLPVPGWESHYEVSDMGRIRSLERKVRRGNRHEASKTRCPRGHELTSPNLVPSEWARGKRSCLACSRGLAYVNTRRRRHCETFTADQIAAICDGYYADIAREAA